MEKEYMYATLLLAVEETGYTHICPECLLLLKGPESRLRHCRSMADETHKGLGLSLQGEFPEFVRCYQLAVGWGVMLSLGDGPGRHSFARFFEIKTVLSYKLCEDLFPLNMILMCHS